MVPPPHLQAETEQLKKQIDELSSRISELMAERDTLQNRNSLLEKVVQVRSTSDKPAQPQVCCRAISWHARCDNVKLLPSQDEWLPAEAHCVVWGRR